MGPIKKVLITRQIAESGLKYLHDQGLILDIYSNSSNRNDLPMPKAKLLERAKSADAIITMLSDQIDNDFLLANKHLKLIANYAVGFNNIDLETCKKLNITVTNTPDAVTRPTVEVTIGLILNCMRKFKKAHHAIMNEEFQGFDPIGFLGNSIYGKTVGIIGMGRIGTEVGRILKEAFHCKILYVSESSVANFGTKTNLENLLSESDIVTIHCPLNIKTKHIINAQNIKLMKPSSYLINTSRGDVIDQEALIKVLSCNQIMGAALDVTSPEPLPKNHPLLKLENVYLLPHIGSASIEARIEMAEICAKNIKDFNLGLTPQNIVN